LTIFIVKDISRLFLTNLQEDLALDQEQGDEQASDSAVAIKKWVNGLELIVSQRNGHERRKCRFMQELFPSRETRLDLSWRRRDVGSSCDRAARLANPILNLAKTSGRCLVLLNSRGEFFVQLAGKPDAKGELLEARDSVLKSHYVIANSRRSSGLRSTIAPASAASSSPRVAVCLQSCSIERLPVVRRAGSKYEDWEADHLRPLILRPAGLHPRVPQSAAVSTPVQEAGRWLKG
jgi:hypothetical protein